MKLDGTRSGGTSVDWTPAAMQAAERYRLTPREREEAEARGRRAVTAAARCVLSCDVCEVVAARAAKMP